MTRDQLEERSKKANTLMKSIQTPSGKAMSGNIQDITNEVLDVDKVKDVLLYFGNIFAASPDVTKLDKSSAKKSVFTKIVDYIGKDDKNENVFSAVKSVKSELSAQNEMIKSALLENTGESGFIKLLIEAIDTQTKILKAAVSDISVSNHKGGSQRMQTMTGNKQATEAMKAMSGVTLDNAKAISMAVDALQKLSFTNLSDFREALVVPIEGFIGLKFDEFKTAIGSFMSSAEDISKLHEKLKTLQKESSELDYNAVSTILRSIREFTLTMLSLSDSSSEFNTEKSQQFIDALVKITGDDKSGLVNAVNNMSSLNPIPEKAKETIDGIAVIASILTNVADIVDKEMIDAMDESLSGLITVIKKSVADLSKIKENDIQKANKTVVTYAEFSTGLADRTKEYAANLKQAKANLENSKNDTDAIFDRMDYTSDRSRESRKKADEAVVSNQKDISLYGVGRMLVISVGVLLIGYWAITKYPDLLKQSVKFAGTLAVFMSITVGTLVIISAIGNRLGASMRILEDMKGVMVTCTFIMLMGALVYAKWGDKVTEYSLRFAKDLAKFMLIVVGTLAIVSRITKYEEDFYKTKNIILILSLTMIIGSLFMLIGNGKLAKAAMLFAVTLSVFMAMVLLTVRIFGGNDERHLDEMKRVINGSAAIMMIGALFVLIGNGKLVKSALLFGAVLSLFITMVLLPFAVFGGLLGKMAGSGSRSIDVGDLIDGKQPKTGQPKSPIEAMYDIIVGSAIILMVGGIFMSLFNGRLAKGALNFAILLGGFIILVGLALMLVTKFIGPKTIGEVNFFKNTVVMFSLILMLGSLLMMFPDFKEHAIGFGLLILAFTVVMGLVFAVITHIVSPKMIPDIAMFAVAVVMFGAILLVGGYLMKVIEPKNIIIFGAILLGFVLGMAGVIYVLTQIDKDKAVEALAIAGLFTVIVLALSVSFYIMAKAMNIMSLEDIGKMILLVGAFIGIFALFLIPYVTAAVNAAAVTVGIMSLALVAICGAFLIVHWMMRNPDWNPMDDIKILEPVLLAYEWMFTKLSIMFPLVIVASIATAMMGVALLSMSTAVMTIHEMTNKRSGIDLIGEATQMSAAIALYSVIFSMMTFLAVPIMLSLPAAIGMSITLTVLAGAFKLVDWIVSSSPDLLEHINLMTAIIGELTAFFSAAGFMSALIVLASVAFTTMSVALTSLSLSFLLIDKIVGDENITWTDLSKESLRKSPLMKKVMFMSEMMKEMSKLFSIVGFPLFVLLIEGASVAFVMMSAAISSMAIAVGAIVGVTALAKTIDEKDIHKVGDIISSFFDAIGDVSWKAMIKIVPLALVMTKAIMPISLSLALMARTISNIAGMKFATKWDPNGNPIEYHVLRNTELKEVKENVKLMTETMITALDAVVKGPFGKDITELGKLGVAKMMFGATNNRLISGIRVSFMLSRLIGSLGKNIASIANLMFPDEWNQQGVATHYVKMTADDLKEAGNGIKNILDVILTAISEWSEKDDIKALIKDYRENDGWLFKGKSKFSAAIKMSMSIGSMIGSLASGVQQYAELKVPEYDNNGNITGYRKLTEPDFTDASNNIGMILNSVITAVETAYDKYENHRDSVLDEFFMVIERTSGLIGAASQAIVDAATLRYVDLEGKPQNFTETDFNKAYGNVVRIMTTMPKAVKESIPKIGDMSDIDKVMSSLQPIGEMLNNVINAIQNYANLRIPTGYDTKGNPDGFRAIDLDDDLTKMGNNISAILTGMVDAVSKAYTNFKNAKGDFDTNAFKLIMNDIGKTGEVFKNLIEAVQAYADLKIPKEYKEDGTVKSYMAITSETELSYYFDKMKSNLTKIMTSFVDVFTDESVNNAIKQFNEINAGNFMAPINTASDIISSVINIVKDYSELKIPRGALDQDGKPVGGYTQLDGKRIGEMSRRISWLLESIPNAVMTAYKNIIKDSEIVDINAKMTNMKGMYENCSNLVGEASGIIQSFSEMKIPIGFDENGKAKGYVAIGGEDAMDNFSKNVISILTMVPNAVAESSAKLTEHGIDENKYKFMKDVIGDWSMKLIKEAIPAIMASYIEIKPLISESETMGQDVTLVIDNIKTAYDSFKNLIAANNSVINPQVFSKNIDNAKASQEQLAAYSDIIGDLTKDTNKFKDRLTEMSKSMMGVNMVLLGMYMLSLSSVMSIINLRSLANNDVLSEEVLRSIRMKLNTVGENMMSLYESIVNPFKKRMFNRNNLVEMSIGIENISLSMKNTVTNFDEAAKKADTMNYLAFGKLSKAISSLNSTEVIPPNAEDNMKILEKESEALTKFVKNVNNIDLQKTRAISSLMEHMANVASSVKDLNEFIKVIKNELTNAINMLAQETKDAKDVLTKTDEQKRTRQEELNKTIEKVEKLMNKTLQINVSSSSVDKSTLSSAYESPKD